MGIRRVLGFGLIALLGAGCYWSRDSRVDANWGSAQRANVRAMIVDPAGMPVGARPDDPTDGRTAQTAVEKYRAEEARPPREAEGTTIVNIGGQ
jgi:type IV pilus biogenesis protein CpaD/CtpE